MSLHIQVVRNPENKGSIIPKYYLGILFVPHTFKEGKHLYIRSGCVSLSLYM